MTRFGPSHLSDEAVVAFADGVLGNGARARAEQHLAACAECRSAVHEQRLAAAMLRSAPLPFLPAGLADRLRSVPATAALPLAASAPTAWSSDDQPVFAAFSTAPARRVPAGSQVDLGLGPIDDGRRRGGSR